MPHTPGPWQFTYLTCGEVGVTKNGVGLLCNLSAAFEAGNMDESEIEPNARLIAAAPELLEACEACIPLLSAGCLAGDLIRAAIAKAKGQ